MTKEPKKKSETKTGPKTTVQTEELQARIDELTTDLQRTRADFENYIRRTDGEKAAAREAGEASTVLRLLPVIDNIERAVSHTPEDMKDNPWAEGVASLVKNLEKSLQTMGLERIEAGPGTSFDPEIHDAIQVDEDAAGDTEVVAEELQSGYRLHGKPIRHAMVKVTRK